MVQIGVRHIKKDKTLFYMPLYGGDLDNNEELYDHDKDRNDSRSEWVLDFSEIVF